VPDAALLEAFYRNGALEIVVPAISSLPISLRLGWGEEESIRLAVEQTADWLLIDDFDARQAAHSSFQAIGSTTQVKGTLGIVVSAYQEGHWSQSEAIDCVNALSQRQDIWVSGDLCRRVIDILSC
jgi:predicted nucleic acid-binding protein